MPGNDLTTLTAVKDWLTLTNTSPSNSDAVLARQIKQASATIMSYLQRATFVSQNYTDTFDGGSNQTFFLNQWPVTGVVSVLVDGIEVEPSSDGREPGWVLSAWDGFPPGQPQQVTLLGGYTACRGSSNVKIIYTAGYLVQAEAQTVPSTGYAVTVDQPLGFWASDAGVTYANGTPFVKVASSPSVGQYAIPAESPNVDLGTYQFAAADAGAGVLMSYSYVPSTVDEACVNLVSERYKYRGRIGQRSQSMGGQTTASYDPNQMPTYVEKALQNFRKILPLW